MVLAEAVNEIAAHRVDCQPRQLRFTLKALSEAMKIEMPSRFHGGLGCRWLVLMVVLGVGLPKAALPQGADGPQSGSVRQANVESLVFIEVTAKRANGLEDKFTGTGFIVHPDGYVLTCNHVIPKKEGSGYTQVVCTGAVGGRFEYPYPLTDIRRDDQGDVMLLKLPRRSKPWRSLQSMTDAQDGWDVVVLGFPQQQDAVDVPGSIIGVDADGRWLTNTALNPGMSGGPAFDRSGAVVGIVEGGYADTQSLNLLIPISSATSLLQSVHSPLVMSAPTPSSTAVAATTPTEIAPRPLSSSSPPVSAHWQGRRMIEVCDFSADVLTADKDEPLKILTRKITRLSERVLADCSEDLSKDNLSKDLLNVGKLEVQKSDKHFSGFGKMADFWHNETLVLEIIDGNIVAKKEPSEMWSDVHLFGLKGSLKDATITIPTEMTGPNLGSVEDLHCAVALYALAMDLKLRYPSLTDDKQKRRYITIISLYLAKIRGYLPSAVTYANQLQRDQQKLSNELWQAAEKELSWCKEEDAKL
jgi:S1-C subfamily serine protease